VRDVSSAPGLRVRTGPAIGLAVALDAALVVTFAALGRGSHSEALSVAGIAGTAWPFLAGAALGWGAAIGLRRRPPVDVTGGVVVWVWTIAGGMALRALTGQGTAFSFIVVASLVTGALLLGWRAIARGLARR